MRDVNGTLKNLSPWILDLRGSVRPLVTYMLVIMHFSCIIRGMVLNLPIEDMVPQSLNYLVLLAVGFWFSTNGAIRVIETLKKPGETLTTPLDGEFN